MRYPILILIILLSLSTKAKADFQEIIEYYGNDHFILNESDGFLVAEINKLPFESFSLKFDNLQQCKNSLCNLKIKSSASIYVKIDLTNGKEIIPNVSKTFIHIEEANTITEVQLDFTTLYSELSSDDDLFLIVYIEPGSSFTGNVEIGEFSFDGNNVNTGILEAYYSSTSDDITMQIPEGEHISQLKMYSLNGQLVKSISQDFSSYEDYSFQLESLNTGIYLIVLQGETNIYSTKILIP